MESVAPTMIYVLISDAREKQDIATRTDDN